MALCVRGSKFLFVDRVLPYKSSIYILMSVPILQALLNLGLYDYILC